MAWLRQAAEHDADHGEADEGGNGSGIALEIARHAAKAADPGERRLHDPALGQDFKTSGGGGTFDNLDCPFTSSGRGLCGFRPLIAAVAMDAFDERKQMARAAAEHKRHAITILDAGGMHCHAQQQAECIYQKAPLATGDLLARIKTPLALWLSMIAVVGLASRPACSRTAKRTSLAQISKSPTLIGTADSPS